MEAKHTTGPWIIDGSMIVPESAIKTEMGYQSGEYVAQVYDTLGKTKKGNAQLIAAAPDLLAALETILSEIWDGKSFGPYGGFNDALSAHKCRETINAAIAKARGE